MKANKLFFYTVASLLTVQSMSPDFINNVQPSHGRMPASAATPAKKKVVKKAVTSKEMKALQDKLAQLEVDLHKKEDVLDQKSKEIELLKNNKTEEKIDALTKLIVEQKADVDKLKIDIKNSEVKDVKIVNQNKTAIEIVVCKSESKGEKLEADIKKLLDDKEEVLKRVDGLKKENDELKLKLTVAPEVKKEEIAKVEVKAEVKAEKEENIAEDKAPVAKKSQALDKKSENSELMALMSQMTTMFTTQMQSQMQMQVQMMNMLSQMQTNMLPQTNPYSPSLYSNSFMNNYAHGYPSLNDSIGSYGLGMGLGIPAQSSPWSDYSNPYSMAPSIKRQQLSVPADFGFSFNQTPNAIRGFDFNQAPAASQKSQQALPQPELQKQQLSFSLPIISA